MCVCMCEGLTWCVCVCSGIVQLQTPALKAVSQMRLQLHATLLETFHTILDSTGNEPDFS